MHKVMMIYKAYYGIIWIMDHENLRTVFILPVNNKKYLDFFLNMLD